MKTVSHQTNETLKKIFKNFFHLFIPLLAVLVLTPAFYNNRWNAAGEDRFYEWRKFQEHMVVARLAESRQNGIFSHGALLGFGNGSAEDFSAERLELEYQVYYEGGRFQYYSAYTSNPGLQGIFFGAFDALTNFDPASNLTIFQLAMSLLGAVTMGIFIYWVVVELGSTAGLFTLIFIAVSEWMTFFGGNIYWNLWAFYLPFIATSMYLMKNSSSQNLNQAKLGVILFITMTIKCIFTGFEYITTAIVMPLIPLIYYAIRDTWGISSFFSRGIKATVGLLSGVFTGLLILLLQITQIKNSLPEAISTIAYAFGKRTYGDPSQFVHESESLRAGLLPVLTTYINGRAIRFSQVFQIPKPRMEISYLDVFIVYLCFTIILLIVMGIFRRNWIGHKTTLAVIATTWVSVAAPLSWFVLFKAHSFDHTHMNFIIWQMPFTLYGFALCGFTIERLLSLIPIKKIYDKLAGRKEHEGYSG